MLADSMTLLCVVLAVVSFVVNSMYCLRRRWRARSMLHALMAAASLFAAAALTVYGLRIASMQDAAGYLLLLAMAFLLAVAMAEGIVDL